MLRFVKRLLGQVYEEVRYFEMPGRLEVGRRMEMLERFKEFCERIGGVLRREKEFVATCVLPRRMHMRVTALKSFDGRVRGLSIPFLGFCYSLRWILPRYVTRFSFNSILGIQYVPQQ